MGYDGFVGSQIVPFHKVGSQSRSKCIGRGRETEDAVRLRYARGVTDMDALRRVASQHIPCIVPFDVVFGGTQWKGPVFNEGGFMSCKPKGGNAAKSRHPCPAPRRADIFQLAASRHFAV